MRKKVDDGIGFFEISDFIQNERYAKRHSLNTVSAYDSDLKDYAIFLKTYRQVFDVVDISEEDINYYLQSLKRRELAKSSIQRKTTAIKMFHKFLFDERITNSNVSLKVKNQKRDIILPSVLTKEEILKMLDGIKIDTKLGIRNKAMCEILFGCGLRVSELLNLTLSDVHLKSKYLDVIGKRDKERLSPLNDFAAFCLRNYIEEARPLLIKKNTNILFVNYKGDPYSRVGFYKYIKKLALENNIDKNISPHTLRHTFATTLLNGGADIRIVQSLLGHESIKTTEIYTHIYKTRLKEVYNKSRPKISENEE